MAKDTSTRSSAAQFYAAAELCRRNYCAVVTMGNTPNTDILCSNKEGTKFVHVQIKTFDPEHNKTCIVGMKGEKYYGDTFFWILCGIPKSINPRVPFQYYIIPSKIMSDNIIAGHKKWASQLGKNGRKRNEENTVRAISLPPYTAKHRNPNGWDVARYLNNWGPIENKLK
jgi:hypothetical protein